MPRLLTATTVANLPLFASLLLGAGCITWSTQPKCDECDDDDEACKMKACVATETSDSDPTTSAGTSSAGTSNPTTTDPTTETTATTTDPTAGTTDPTGPSTTGPDPFCGDGNVDDGEECDNGDDNANSAACKSDCTANTCGDGHILEGVEACDDGEANANTAACKSDCTAQACGDGYLGPGEQCDDSNTNAGDGCSPTCQRETLLAFVTSTEYKGNLLPALQNKTGLDLADAQCQARAEAAILPGTYRAWLSNASTGPAARFGLNPFPGQFKLTNGTVIAESWADLTDGTLLAPLDRDESGKFVASSYVWSNTQANGSPVGSDHCQNWSTSSITPKGRVGATEFTSSTWTNLEPIGCGGSARLYCFQVSP